MILHAVLSSPGISSVIVFRDSASNVLNLTFEAEDDQQDLLIEKFAKTICNEIKQIDR